MHACGKRISLIFCPDKSLGRHGLSRPFNTYLRYLVGKIARDLALISNYLNNPTSQQHSINCVNNTSIHHLQTIQIYNNSFYLTLTPAMDWPKFEDLPLDKSGPPGNAWGLFGKNDQLGRLNLITPLTVKEAASEITTGIRVSLDWPMNKPSFPAFERARFDHQLINYAPRAINDDTLAFNTQCSTQWDGFRHYGQY